jgi:hypothetical protein
LSNCDATGRWATHGHANCHQSVMPGSGHFAGAAHSCHRDLQVFVRRRGGPVGGRWFDWATKRPGLRAGCRGGRCAPNGHYGYRLWPLSSVAAKRRNKGPYCSKSYGDSEQTIPYSCRGGPSMLFLLEVTLSRAGGLLIFPLHSFVRSFLYSGRTSRFQVFDQVL